MNILFITLNTIIEEILFKKNCSIFTLFTCVYFLYFQTTRPLLPKFVVIFYPTIYDNVEYKGKLITLFLHPFYVPEIILSPRNRNINNRSITMFLVVCRLLEEIWYLRDLQFLKTGSEAFPLKCRTTLGKIPDFLNCSQELYRSKASFVWF